MNNLPAGFVDLRFAIMHVSEIRPHTNDIHRFLKYLAPALELYATELGLQQGKDAQSVWRVMKCQITKKALGALG